MLHVSLSGCVHFYFLRSTQLLLCRLSYSAGRYIYFFYLAVNNRGNTVYNRMNNSFRLSFVEIKSAEQE